jgi:phosphoglycolate phosphatase
MPRIAHRSLAAIVFDFDGTLARLTIDFPEMRRRVVAAIRDAGAWRDELDALHVLEMVRSATDALASPAAEELAAECFGRIEAVEVHAADTGALLPGVADALGRLRASKRRLGVITRNCRRAVLAVAPTLPEHVDALLARDDVSEVKPSPLHVHACLGAMGVPNGAAALVGDHVMDMETARAAGVRAVGVLTGACDGERLWAAGADAVHQSVVEFTDAVLGGG